MPKRRATLGRKKVDERRITLAGRKLKKLLTRTTISAFAKNAGVDRIAVHRLLNGERWRHVDVNFAIAVRDETGGVIAIEDFAAITAIPVEDAEKEEPRSRLRTGTDG